MINVSTTAASKITELLAEEKRRQRPAGVRSGRRLLGLSVRLDDRREGGRRATRCSSRTASGCSSTRSASAISRAPRSISSTPSPAGGSPSRTRMPCRPAAAARRSRPKKVRRAGGGISLTDVVTEALRHADLPDLERVRPAGGKRPASATSSSMCSSARRASQRRRSRRSHPPRRQRISRATVYRTLQWMIDAGIARKVDFGEGRFRFEHCTGIPGTFI